MLTSYVQIGKSIARLMNVIPAKIENSMACLRANYHNAILCNPGNRSSRHLTLEKRKSLMKKKKKPTEAMTRSVPGHPGATQATQSTEAFNPYPRCLIRKMSTLFRSISFLKKIPLIDLSSLSVYTCQRHYILLTFLILIDKGTHN